MIPSPFVVGSGRSGKLPTILFLVALFAAAGLAVSANPWFVLVIPAGLLVFAFVGSPWAAFGAAGALLALQYPLVALVPEETLGARLAAYSDDALVLALPLLVLVHGANRFAPRRPLHVTLGALGIALFLGAFSAWRSAAPIVPAAADAFALSKSFLVFFAAWHIAGPPDELLQRLRWVTAFGVALAAIGFVDLLAPSLTHDWIPIAGPIAFRGGERCLVSVFANEGMAGWFFAAVSCIPIASFLVLRRRMDLLIGAFLVLASLLSYRRKPVLGLLTALALVFALLPSSRGRWRGVVALVFVAAVTVPIVGEVFGETFSDAWYGYVLTPEPMRNARNALYIGGWEIARDAFPLGAGLGRFGGYASTLEYSPFYDRYGLSRVSGLTADDPSFVADAFYPHILGALGWLGALAYLFALLRPTWSLASAFRSPEAGDSVRIVTVIAFLIAVEGLVEAIVAPVYEASLTSFVVAAPAGLALGALWYGAAAERKSAPNPIPR